VGVQREDGVVAREQARELEAPVGVGRRVRERFPGVLPAAGQEGLDRGQALERVRVLLELDQAEGRRVGLIPKITIVNF
jgi:hypothetical protein